MSLSNHHLILFLFVASQTLSAQFQNQTSDFPWNPSTIETRSLLSNNSVFAAGFLPSPNTTDRFIFAVYYANISKLTTIWTVNVDSPVNNSSSLFITSSGELRLGEVRFPGSPTSPENTTPLLQLRNDGNLVFGNWSSFLYPTDTILPNQNISGTFLSVKRGTFVFTGNKLYFNAIYQKFQYYKNDNAFLRLDDEGMVHQENGVSFVGSDKGDRTLRRLKLDEDGNLRIYSYDSYSRRWNVVWQAVAVPDFCRVRPALQFLERAYKNVTDY